MEELKLELVLKRPKDKPPFIGVLFQNEFRAAKFNEWWILNPNETTNIGLEIEPKKELLELRIVHAYANGSIYKIQNFHAFELHQFLIYAMSQQLVNFGHVLIKENKHIPARTLNDKLWVLKINKITFLREY